MIDPELGLFTNMSQTEKAHEIRLRKLESDLTRHNNSNCTVLDALLERIETLERRYIKPDCEKSPAEIDRLIESEIDCSKCEDYQKSLNGCLNPTSPKELCFKPKSQGSFGPVQTGTEHMSHYPPVFLAREKPLDCKDCYHVKRDQEPCKYCHDHDKFKPEKTDSAPAPSYNPNGDLDQICQKCGNPLHEHVGTGMEWICPIKEKPAAASPSQCNYPHNGSTEICMYCEGTDCNFVSKPIPLCLIKKEAVAGKLREHIKNIKKYCNVFIVGSDIEEWIKKKLEGSKL